MSKEHISEKEKCQLGLLYDANYDKDLIEERNRCKDLCHLFNSCLPSEHEKRGDIMRRILGKTGKEFLIEQSFWCDYGYNIAIGENFYANHGCVILDAANVTFGDNVFIAPNCGFYTAGHPVSPDLRNRGLEYARSITVGDNVWFGGNVSVMPGVVIGDNTIIGSGSVVTKNIPSGVIAAGNPCRVLRNITSEEMGKERKSVEEM
ncbi:Acetyltransferase (isoleucine patch superfamily) [Faecalicatena contorta]|uniref:Acetyltransferase n=1 Tax=Faecalicatena contorta TaxID=39482 RepID=A0A316A1Y5_9FIRM|nr:sugar O-acetyltransferase [Faecalicatena contorta]PWJ51861.1 acetyltransferase-like isoleucine patch superfamily enzyme [Faecalicatena contorta]SUQ12117.1 Acetyltransferase (isoleucine patch superfamily) [Faecalicatena contorta]